LPLLGQASLNPPHFQFQDLSRSYVALGEVTQKGHQNLAEHFLYLPFNFFSRLIKSLNEVLGKDFYFDYFLKIVGSVAARRA
jgi:hypothetical protein